MSVQTSTPTHFDTYEPSNIDQSYSVIDICRPWLANYTAARPCMLEGISKKFIRKNFKIICVLLAHRKSPLIDLSTSSIAVRNFRIIV